jgi:hypothetical protein
VPPLLMEMVMRVNALGLAALAAPLFALPAIAHHSFAMFDQSKVLTMTGTVKQLEFINPHTWLHLVITGPNGKDATWSFEGGSPAQLAALGWKPDNFHAGDKVSVGFRPMKDGSRGGQLMSVKLPNGLTVCSNRGCGDGSGAILAPF